MAKKKTKRLDSAPLTQPETRLERYLAQIANLAQTAPSDPRTRLERYLDAILQSGGGITPDTPISVAGLVYGNSDGEIEGVAPDMTAQNIEDYLEAVQAAVNQGGVPGFSQLVRPNLLDNWYFVGGGSQQGGGKFPINQKVGYVVPDGVTYYSDDTLTTSAGTTSAYTTAVYVNTTYGTISVGGTTYYVAYGDMMPGYTAPGYGIDRWKVNYNDPVIVKPTCVTIPNIGRFYQVVEDTSKLIGKTITLSFLTGYGLVTGTVTFDGSNADWVRTDSVVIGYSLQYNCFFIYNNLAANLDLFAAKLEIGSNQTLAHQENGVWVLNEIPKYGDELLECQRYYQLYSTQSLRPSNAVDCRPVMRITPTQGTIAIDGTTHYYNDANL